MRVLLTNLPPLLKDLLSESLAGESDMAVVGGAASADLVTLVRQLSPDAVLTGASRALAEGLARAVQSIETPVGLVAIDPDARHAFVVAPGEATRVLSDISPTTIIAAIRSVQRSR
jgi:DNA-binding NarL/FixJ family response regulator